MLQSAAALLVIFLATLVDAAVVHVTNGTGLVDAIRDDAVTSIFLDGDVRFEPEQWPATVYRLERNLTVTSDLSGSHKVRLLLTCRSHHISTQYLRVQQLRCCSTTIRGTFVMFKTV